MSKNLSIENLSICPLCNNCIDHIGFCSGRTPCYRKYSSSIWLTIDKFDIYIDRLKEHTVFYTDCQQKIVAEYQEWFKIEDLKNRALLFNYYI